MKLLYPGSYEWDAFIREAKHESPVSGNLDIKLCIREARHETPVSGKLWMRRIYPNVSYTTVVVKLVYIFFLFTAVYLPQNDLSLATFSWDCPFDSKSLQNNVVLYIVVGEKAIG